MQLKRNPKGDHKKTFSTQKSNLSELGSALYKKPKIEAPMHHLDFFGALLPQWHDLDQSVPKSSPIHLKYKLCFIKS